MARHNRSGQTLLHFLRPGVLAIGQRYCQERETIRGEVSSRGIIALLSRKVSSPGEDGCEETE
jgi:hypothetical protein